MCMIECEMNASGHKGQRKYVVSFCHDVHEFVATSSFLQPPPPVTSLL
ncbi:2818_t:CDS:2 [Diversispora eburnea]|uniref:2818_t:CDS:1 n=1 Tax=Diversispora eburnea TaxID=1213867 RepID=A0A9N8UZX3_9GLOM|nr:2818_t:CDS:2 [Diversispora eburnea]